jgi:hypothetical protein
MNARKLKLGIKALLLLCVTYIAVAIATEVAYYFLVPAKYFELFPGIGVFYLILGVIFFYTLVHYRNTTQTHLLNVYMFAKMVKLFLTLIFIVIYIFIFDPHKRAFAMTMLANYIVFSGMDLYIYSLFIRRLTKHEKKHKNNK